MEMEVPGVAVIGTGRRALGGYIKVLVEEFAERMRVVAVSDRVPERLEEARESLGPEVKLFSDHQELLGFADVDAVIVCTPDFAHEQISLDCLRADKHVICEKPLALTFGGCERIVQEAQSRGKLLQVGLVLRYSQFHQRLKEVVERGTIGRTHLISVLDYYAGGRTYFRRWNRFRKNTGGLLIHKGCHAFDIINWLANSFPKRVAAFGSLAVFKPGTKPSYAQHCSTCPEKYSCIDSVYVTYDRDILKRQEGYTDFDLCLYNSEKDTQDSDVVIIEYENGVKACYTECLFSTRTGRFYSIVGEKGEIEADSESNRIKVHSVDSKETMVYQIPDISGHGGGDRMLLEDFLTCLQRGGKPLADGEAGSWATAVGEAAEKAIAERRIVDMEELR